jgi:sorbitol-specific phosphotransferase system component IIC
LALPSYSIVINYVSEGEVANLIRGYVVVNGTKVRFSGVAYGRFGGQNFSPQFSKAAVSKLATLTGDFPKFEEDLQLRLVRGDFDARPGKNEHHHHLHLGEKPEVEQA